MLRESDIIMFDFDFQPMTDFHARQSNTTAYALRGMKPSTLQEVPSSKTRFSTRVGRTIAYYRTYQRPEKKHPKQLKYMTESVHLLTKHSFFRCVFVGICTVCNISN